MHENHASIVALHRLKTFFKKSADTFASTQYNWTLLVVKALNYVLQRISNKLLIQHAHNIPPPESHWGTWNINLICFCCCIIHKHHTLLHSYTSTESELELDLDVHLQL